jgi:hypothetical protein
LGRHSSKSGLVYYLSLAAWTLPWIVVASLVGIAIWTSVGVLGGDGVAVSTPPTPTPSPTTRPTPNEPTPADEVDPTPTPTPKQKDPNRTKLITEGVTVQVINGTGGIEGAAEAMADRLARLGFQVEAFTTGLTVNQSFVYYTSPDSMEAAKALATRLGFAFAPASSNLTSSIDLHVVVSAADA